MFNPNAYSFTIIAEATTAEAEIVIADYIFAETQSFQGNEIREVAVKVTPIVDDARFTFLVEIGRPAPVLTYAEGHGDD